MMEQLLRNKLKSGETLLWCCAPEEFTFMDKTHAAAYKKKWITVLAVSAVIMAIYLVLVVKLGAAFNLLIPGMLLVAIGYGLLSDKTECKALQNKTMYGLTDKRVVVLKGVGMTAAEYATIPNFYYDTDADGHITLMCGDWPQEEQEHQRRMGTIRGICTDPNTGVCRSVVMYAVPKAEADKAMDILNQYIA